MERLSQMKKYSTERLIQKLVKAGYDETEMKTKSREELIAACVDLIEEGEHEESASKSTSVEELFKMMMQMMMKEREERSERDQQEREERKEQYERDRRERIEREEKEMNERKLREEKERAERERWEAERKMERDDYMKDRKFDREMRESQLTKNEEKEKTKEAQTKKFGELMKNVLPIMPENEYEVPVYMQTIENMFDLYSVPNDIRPALLMPYLSVKAKKIVCNMKADEMKSYDGIKKALLREFRQTAKEYRNQFLYMNKRYEESWNSFMNRLRVQWQYYLNSRNITTFEKLIDLIIADRLKDSMQYHMRAYVVSKEADETFESSKIADLANIYEANALGDRTNFNWRQNRRGQFEYQEKKDYKMQVTEKPKGRSQSLDRLNDKKHTPSVGQKSLNSERKACFICGSLYHLSRTCPKKTKNVQAAAVNATYDLSNHSNSLTGRTSRDKYCATCNSKSHAEIDCWRRKDHELNDNNTTLKSVMRVSVQQFGTAVGDNDGTQVFVRHANENKKNVVENHNTNYESLIECFGPLVSSYFEGRDAVNEKHLTRVTTNSLRETRSAAEQTQQGNSSDVFTTAMNEERKLPAFSANVCSVGFSKLMKVNVVVGGYKMNAIVDSGTEIVVINRKNYSFDNYNTMSKVQLSSPLGISVIADVKCLPTQLYNENTINEGENVNVICAVVDLQGDTECLLTTEAYNELLKNMYCQYGKCTDLTENEVAEANALLVNAVTEIKLNENEVKDANVDVESPVHILATEQRSDDSLNTCFEMAENKKANYYIRKYDKLLFHIDTVNGQSVHRLVVPKGRRKEILHKAHDSVWGGHLGSKKTLQRIKQSFYWPEMKRDVTQYCATCMECQLHRRVTKSDRVPITPVTRPDNSFDVVNVDLIGPFEPKSSRGHSYILCLVDQCSRYPDAICLTAPTAKNTCDALLEIFARTSIPKVIVMDNATNFTSALTREFLARLGVSPRFSTPYHPEGNSVVERWNQVLKNMLRAIVKEHPRDWDKQVPFLLWAYREVPNATTGVSPHEMIFGRPVRGPLQLLKDTWTGEMTVPPSISKSGEEYLQILKERLEEAKIKALENSDVNQKAYTSQYNLRSMDKTFEIGENILILMADSENKLYSNWTPGIIQQKKSPYSYIVQTSDGRIKHLHANKLRKLNMRVQAIGVINGEDTDFGDIDCVSLSVSENQMNYDIGHLTEIQQRQLSDVLTDYKDVFSDKPGRCKIGCHEIKVRDGYEPIRSKPYRIPERLKDEVDKQIAELLSYDMIEPSNSPYAHPIVCVTKPDKSIRICTDMRNLNAHTVDDRFPMRNIEDIIYKVGNSKYISVFDAVKGYNQIILHPDSVDKTTFITHNGAWRWKVMCFGLKNAGASYQRIMNKILEPHGRYAVAYIDDIAVYSDTWEDHLKHIAAVLHSFREAGITFRLDKCKFAHSELKFLGHKIGNGTVQLNELKVESIMNIERPFTKKALRSYLGLMNYYRAHIPDYAKIASCLTDLTKLRQPATLQWTTIHQNAFEQLKIELCKRTILHVPDFSAPFIIQADSSGYAVGACLAQERNGKEVPIAYASAKLAGNQLNWSTIEKEAYAIIFALKKFECFVYNSKIFIYTDHNPLQFLTQCTPRNARLLRWSLALQNYNIEIRHKKGKLNSNCDALSRLI